MNISEAHEKAVGFRVDAVCSRTRSDLRHTLVHAWNWATNPSRLESDGAHVITMDTADWASRTIRKIGGVATTEDGRMIVIATTDSKPVTGYECSPYESGYGQLQS